jgi:hypothetical protein
MQLTLIATVFDSLAMFLVFGIGALYGWCRRGGYVQR